MSQILPPAELAKKETTAQLLWTGVIIVFFVIQAILWIVAITLTHNDPSNGIVENYDQKALNWNEHRQLLAASERLGWKWTVDFSEKPAFGVSRMVTVRLQDRSGQPIEDAQIELKAFHRARSAEVQQKPLAATEIAGVYQSPFELAKPGNWQWELEAQLGDSRFMGKVIQLVD